jgi:hypothetical protein
MLYTMSPHPRLVSSPPQPPPSMFTSTNGTIQGAIDGVNVDFILPAMLERARVWRNGIFQTLNWDVAASGNSIKFLLTPPRQGDSLLVIGWILP